MFYKVLETERNALYTYKISQTVRSLFVRKL